MFYGDLQAQLAKAQAEFAKDVLQYLLDTGRADRGRSYFGMQACVYPDLVSRLERGLPVGIDVMERTRAFMQANPAPSSVECCSAPEERLAS